MSNKYTYISACVAFFIAGFILSCWSPLVPIVKENLSLTDGNMGGILLLFGIGSLVSMPISGHLVNKMGCRHVMSASLISSCFALILLGISSNIYILSCSLFLFGVSVGSMDVIVNINAAIVQNRLKKSIMSSMHALFSFGAFAGSGAVSLGLYFKINTILALSILILAVLVSYFVTHRGLTLEKNKGEPINFSLPSKSILLFGVGCWIAYLIEGSMLDWSGIFLKTNIHTDVNVAGFAFTSFSAAMMMGRLFGDRVTNIFGEKKVFRSSMIILIIGILSMLVSNSLTMIFSSLFMIGIGLANIAPLLFSRTSHKNPDNIPLSISQVSTLGYMGILLGPAIIGCISNLTSINFSFLFIAIITIILSFASFTKMFFE